MGLDEEDWAEWLASIREGWGTRAWVVRNARWMGPSMLDDPDELEHWITYIRFSPGPSSAESVMRQDKDTDSAACCRSCRRRRCRCTAPATRSRRSTRGATSHRRSRVRASSSSRRRRHPMAGDAGAVLDEVERSSPVGGATCARTAGSRPCSSPTSSARPSSLVALGDAAWRERLAEHDAIVSANRPAVGPVRRLRRRRRAGDVRRAGRRRACARRRSGRAAAPRPRGARGSAHRRGRARGGGCAGVAVHIGARIAALAGPGEVLVSSVVRDLTAGSGLTFEDAGEHELKGIPDRWRLFRVVAPSMSAGS